jgi:hypothetical protein
MSFSLFNSFNGNSQRLGQNYAIVSSDINAPGAVSSIGSDSSSVTFSFSAPTTGGTISGYTAYVNGKPYAGTGGPSSYTISGLSAGGQYTINMVANIVSTSSTNVTTTSTFIPTSVTGCFLWLDAADNSTITYSSGSNISQWNDKSTNGYNFSGATTYTAMPNGKNAVYFNGSQNMSTIFNTITFPTNFTIFVIAYASNSGQNNFIRGSPDQYFFLRSKNYKFEYALGNGTWKTFYLSPTETLNNLSLIALTYSSSNTQAAGYLNTNLLSTITVINTPYIGSILIGGPNEPLTGHIAEILIYDSVLSTTDRQSIEGYLSWKWGLQANLPSAHPYYSASPGGTTSTVTTNTNNILSNPSPPVVLSTLASHRFSQFYLNTLNYLMNYYNFNQSTNLTSNYNVVNNNLIVDYATTNNLTTSNYNSGQTPVLEISSTKSLTSPYSLYFAGGESFWVNFTLPAGCPGFSVSVWFYPTTSASTAFSPNGYPRIWASSLGDSYSVYHPTNALNLAGDTINASMILNTWNHLVGVYDITTNTRRYYFNGALTATNSGSGYTANSTYNISFGNKQNDSLDPFIGYMDEMRFYSNVLSANDVKQLYAYTGATPSAKYFPLSPTWTPSYSSLVAYFMLDENSGATSAVDQINAYNGTVVNGSTFGATGKVGNCATFNGSNSYISLPYQVFNNLSSGTIMAWIYFTSLTSGAILTKQHDGASSIVFSVEAGYLRFTNGPGTVLVIESTTLLSINTWYHVAYTFTETSASFYINGILDKTITPGTNVIISNTGPIYGAGTLIMNDTTPTYTAIGAWPNNGGMSSPFAGQIDDFSVWNTALSGNNIATIYNNQNTVFLDDAISAVGLVKRYKFASGDIVGGRLYNYATQTYDATVYNSPVFSTSVYKTGTSSLFFNGTNQYVNIDTFTLDATNITITGWFNTSASGWSRLFDFGNGPSSNNFMYAIGMGASVYQNATSNASVAGGYGNSTWRFLVWTLTNTGSNSGTWNIYIDNVSVYTNNSISFPLSVSRTMNYLMNSNWTQDGYTAGYLNDFRIYSRILNTSEIASLYAYR